MNTARGAYSKTPPKTMAKIKAMLAKVIEKAKQGDDPQTIIQDFVDGYSIGWNSAERWLIEMAAKRHQKT